MDAADVITEIFAESDSGDSDFEEVFVNDNMDNDGDVYMSDAEPETDNEGTAARATPDGNQPEVVGTGQQARRVQGGGDAYRAALPTAYQHD